MSIVKVEVQLSSEELLKAVEQLNQPDLERFVSQLLFIPVMLFLTNLKSGNNVILLFLSCLLTLLN